MTKFKDALDEYEGDYLDFYNGPPSEKTDATIRLALRIAQAVTEGTSQSVNNCGAIKLAKLDEIKASYGVQADMTFRAMIEQMMREIEND